VDPGRIRTHRHRFSQRLRWPIAFAWAAVLGLDLTLSLLGLTHREWKAGLLLLGPVVAYLLSHQLLHRASRWRLPKELCVAALLAAGAAVFIAARPEAHLRAMAVPLAIFALLCLSNCALISVWEDEVDRSQGQTSLALQFVRGAAFSRTLPWLLSALCAAAWFCAGERSRAAAACGAASGVLLGLTDLAERRIGRTLARVLADVAVATPAVPLVLRMLP
jgi:4-hydroxybenzoate polyprenyltransferase